jgi:hypothetical protein
MKLPPLNHSNLRDFKNCPHKAFRRYFLKDVPFKSTDKMAQGRKDHRAIEDRLNKGIALDRHLRAVEPLCAYIDTLPDHLVVRTEYYLGLTVDGRPCSSQAGDVWLRTLADLVIITPMGGWFVDWKTGRPWEDPFELEIQALLCAAHHNEVPLWEGQYFWLQTGELGERYTLHPADTFQAIAKLWGEMHGYLASGVWPKRQNKLCAWCDVPDCTFNTNPEIKDRTDGMERAASAAV